MEPLLPSSNPINLGFDINIAGHAAGAPESYLGRDNFEMESPAKKLSVPGLEKYHGEDIFLTEALTKEVLEAVSEPVENKQPFSVLHSTGFTHL